MTSPSPLADRFPRFTEADWRGVVADTTGRTPNEFCGHSDDGIAIGPIYRRHAGGRAIAGRPPGQPWRIVQRLAAGDAIAAAAESSEAIAGGANGFAAVFETSPHPLPGKLPLAVAGDLALAFAERLGEGGDLHLDAGEATPALAVPFIEAAAGKGWRLALAFDPVAALAARGRSGQTLDDSAAQIVAAAASLDARAIDGSVAIADGRLWHAGGASEAQELAATLATVVWLLRLFEANGQSLERAAARIGVALATDADQFLTIAKFRAMRLTLRRVFDLSGIAAPLPPIHAETAWRMMGRRDPHSNILRTTIAAFSAAVGGADSITVLPFDALFGAGDGLARRLACNTQTILAEEAHLFRVADPGAGSGAVEGLTAALAEAAWRRFQAIEAQGGIPAALAGGSPQKDIATVREARALRVRERGVAITGVNAHADSDVAEGAAPPRRPAAPAAGALAEEVEALVFMRLPEPFEGSAAADLDATSPK